MRSQHCLETYSTNHPLTHHLPGQTRPQLHHCKVLTTHSICSGPHLHYTHYHTASVFSRFTYTVYACIVSSESFFRISFFCGTTSRLGLGLFSPPPPGISILCWLSPVPAFQHPLSIPVHRIKPSPSVPFNWSSSFCVSFQCFLGHPFIILHLHMTHPLESSVSDIPGQLHFLV